MRAWNEEGLLKRSETVYQRLQLPIPADYAAEAHGRFWSTYVESFGKVDPDDALLALDGDVDEWLHSLTLSRRLGDSMSAALDPALARIGDLTTSDYVKLIHSVIDSYTLSISDSVKLCSQLPLIKFLVDDFDYSASAVEAVLNAKLRIPKLNTGLVQDVAGKVASLAAPDVDYVDKIFDLDTRLSEEVFADADVPQIAETLDHAAAALGAPPIGRMFSELTSHGPYIQMLHWQCLLIEPQDFDPTILYEHSPRGVVAKHLFAKHADVGIGTGGSPYLNNAKSAYAADMQWAMQKKASHRAGAVGLSEILQALKEQPYHGRKSLASMLRWAVHKVIDIRRSEGLHLLVPIEEAETAWRWLSWVTHSNTESRGIFEQRAADHAVACMFPKSDGWELRGIGDAVNASNLSREKFGDEEAVNTHLRTVRAFEPHGGTLTQVYVDEHIRSLRRVMEVRKSSLEPVAPLTEWDIRVTFIAHSHQLKAQEHKAGDATVNVRFLTFAELLSEESLRGAGVLSFNKNVIDALNRPGVTADLRQSAASRLAAR